MSCWSFSRAIAFQPSFCEMFHRTAVFVLCYLAWLGATEAMAVVGERTPQDQNPSVPDKVTNWLKHLNNQISLGKRNGRFLYQRNMEQKTRLGFREAALRTALGRNPCSFGPSFWCSSHEHMVQCKAEVYCKGKIPENSVRRNSEEQLLGRNPCTWGPSYWCASDENTVRCKAHKYCQQKAAKERMQSRGMVRQESVLPPAVGTDPCDQGPSYWCDSTANMQLCYIPQLICQDWRMRQKSRQKGLPSKGGKLQQQRSPEDQPVGGNPCTWGPSYWCSSGANIERCHAQEYCRDRTGKTSIPRKAGTAINVGKSGGNLRLP